jgi:hypothetical protein
MSPTTWSVQELWCGLRFAGNANAGFFMSL